MTLVGGELRRLAVSVQTDVHVGAYTAQTGAELRDKLLELADLADDRHDATAVIAFLNKVKDEVKDSGGSEVKITLIDTEPAPAPAPMVVSAPNRRRRSLEEKSALGRRPKRSSRVSVQVGSRAAVTSDVAFGPDEIPLLMAQIHQRDQD